MRIPLPQPVINEQNCVGCMKCMEACAHHHGIDHDLEHVCFKIKEMDTACYQVRGCYYCGKCASVCPSEAIQKNRLGIYKINEKKCIRCGKCVNACPDGLIHLISDKPSAFMCERCGECVKACKHGVIGHKFEWVKIL